MEHQRVLDRANLIFLEKSRVRGQMWLEFPPSDKIRELRERVTRLENAYKLEPDALIKETMIGDALDIINYSAFLIKQLERGMRG
jgi:hypothetical protein